MPVTIKIVDHPAKEWTDKDTATPEKLLESSCPKQYRRSRRVVQSSFVRSGLGTKHISASKNGFVKAAYQAYSAHHHLVIRPEDVWFAILTQLSFFINKNAEDLRAFFVEHAGQKHLEAISDVADFGALALQMTDLIAKNVNDPELKDWVMPSFSTTTFDDKVVGAVLFMGAMQSYFSYGFTVMCGLPSVTLLGDVADWREILRRLEKIDLLGEEPKQFACMLRPILQYMVLSFENPTSTEVENFWNVIVHRNHVGSGTDYLSGWLTAFCFWDEDGKASQRKRKNIQFGNVQYPTVPINKITTGYASVPVKVNDFGNEYEATMIAGSVGIAAFHSNEQETPENTAMTNDSSGAAMKDTIQPLSGWWICENESAEEVERREEEKKRLRDEIAREGEQAREHSYNSDAWQEYFAKTRRLKELEAY